MSLPEWPVLLPKPLLSSYAVKKDKALLKSKMQSGYIRARRIPKNPTSTHKVKFLFTTEQLGIFERWVEDAANHGANAFYIDISFPAGLKKVEARLLDDSLDFKPRGNKLWEISTSIEIKNTPVIEEQVFVQKILSQENTNINDFVESIQDSVSKMESDL